MKNLLKACLFFTILFSMTGLHARNSDDFNTFRQRVIKESRAVETDPGRISSWLREQQADGTWPDINYNDTTNTGFDHGPEVQGGSYAYMVLPGIEDSEVHQKKDDTGMEILVNSESLQAVRFREPGLVQAAFYEKGMLKISEGLSLECESGGMLILKMDESHVSEIWVSDPTRKHAQLKLKLISGSEKRRLRADLPCGPYAGSSTNLKMD